MNVIKVSRLHFNYAHVPVLRDVSFEIDKGGFLAIAGPNGAGKSTLLNLLAGLLKPASGTIKIESLPMRSYSAKDLAKKLAVVRQEYVPVFGFSVFITVVMARTPYYDRMGFARDIDKAFAAEALELTDTAQFAARSLEQLSAGERQRVFIARALAQNTDILLLDEPTSFLDLKHQVAIYDLLKTAQLQKSKTIIAVTHDINHCLQYADTVLLLADDNTYTYGTSQKVLRCEQIEKVFAVKTIEGNIGTEKFFFSLGKYAKCSSQNNVQIASRHRKQPTQ